MEQAQATCRETVGRPIVQACMGGQGRGPDAEQRREACRAKATPSVRACVMAAMNKANGRANVAIAVDDGKTKKEAIDLGNALPAGFVAPPRTIADITAVLDNEKPDPATLAKLKDEADDEPEKGLSVSDLAEFYLRPRQCPVDSRPQCGRHRRRREGPWPSPQTAASAMLKQRHSPVRRICRSRPRAI